MTDPNPLPDCLSHLAQRSPAYQHRVHDWMLHCFDATVAADRVERNHRFLEEALELVQAGGGTAAGAHALVDYVFGRPQGDVGQEIGGTLVCLAALCNAHGANLEAAGESELARNWANSDKIHAKWLTKPVRSGPIPASSMQLRKHEWGPSRVGHGEQQCIHCLMTNREAMALGEFCLHG